ncbi:MAG TPA: LytTR family DNA-binding domain-containing protein [Bacteroidales bacterium]|nr:LytTR family DNA-binding domain-containing protein [Bacteroidales bacterium]
MSNIFDKPYPYNDDLKYNTVICFFISIGIFIFLYAFQPFAISSIPPKERYYLITGFAVVTFLALSFNLLVLPSLFPKIFTAREWNIKKEIIWYTWILSTILTGLFLLNNSLGVMKVSFNLVIGLILIAVIPITVLIIVNHNRILRIHLRLADELNKKLKENKSIQEKMIYFNSAYQKDSLAIKVNSLLFIRSANNYIEVFWKEGDVIKNQMVRYSISSAEEATSEYKFILKCHRSYIVNINHIDKIEGNSQGYRLFFENISSPVPVSKNFVDKLKELL